MKPPWNHLFHVGFPWIPAHLARACGGWAPSRHGLAAASCRPPSLNPGRRRGDSGDGICKGTFKGQQTSANYTYIIINIYICVCVLFCMCLHVIYYIYIHATIQQRNMAMLTNLELCLPTVFSVLDLFWICFAYQTRKERLPRNHSHHFKGYVYQKS